MWAIPKITDKFKQKMNDVLEVYEREYNPQQPVVCLDEKSKQIVSTPRGSIPARPGKKKKTDYEYKRHGTRNIFVAVEPKNVERHYRVTKRRTGKDFAKIIKYLVTQKYKDAEKLILVCDNLNTHKKQSILDEYGEEEGQKICDKIEWHYTPEHASWLNIAEIEISTIRSLRKRIPDEKTLLKEVKNVQNRRNKLKSKIEWGFTRKKAKKWLNYCETKRE